MIACRCSSRIDTKDFVTKQKYLQYLNALYICLTKVTSVKSGDIRITPVIVVRWS